MVKYGIISDTHVLDNEDANVVKHLLAQLKTIFKDVDEILHAGDVCDSNFLVEISRIAPTKCVMGNMDKILDLEDFIKFSIGRYNIGIIHEPPEDFKTFFQEHELNILIYGHTHQPIIEGTEYDTLILNPGSPTKPIAPPSKKGFQEPVARKTVMTLEINEKNDILTTFIINIK